MGVILEKILGNSDNNTKFVFKSASASVLVKSLGLLSGLLVSLLLGRNLGAEDYGTLELSLKIINIINILCLFGMPNIILREVAISYSNGDISRVGNLIYTSSVITSIIAIIFIVILKSSLSFLSNSVFNNSDLKLVLSIYLFAIIFQSFSRIYATGINGYKKIWQSNLVNEALSLVIILTGIILIKFFGITIDLRNIAILYLTGRIIVTVTVGVYWKSLFPVFKIKRTFLKNLIKPSLSLLLVSASGVIIANSGAIILGIFSTSTEVAYFSVAAKIALLTIFFLQVTNSAIAPSIASLYSNNKREELLKMLKSVTKVLFIIGLGSFLFFAITGKLILSLWGAEFKNAYFLLIILSFGQFINITTGSVGVLLMMTGNEKSLSKISIFFVLVYIFLNIGLIHYFGMYGAAIATFIYIAGENITKTVVVYKKLGIYFLPIKLKL